MPAHPLIDYLEKTFGDAYRKEVDQEENVWRTLPFFAATMALQVAALVPQREWVMHAAGRVFIAAVVLLAAAGAATSAALCLLALSVWPPDYRRVMREPEILALLPRLRRETA